MKYKSSGKRIMHGIETPEIDTYSSVHTLLILRFELTGDLLFSLLER